MTPKRVTSVPGLFGGMDHYDENGNYAGESWPGLFEGSMEHYDANGQYAGYSDPGLFADSHFIQHEHFRAGFFDRHDVSDQYDRYRGNEDRLVSWQASVCLP